MFGNSFKALIFDVELFEFSEEPLFPWTASPVALVIQDLS